MQSQSMLARMSALVVAALIASCAGIQAKILFPGCGGLCIMDPAPGAVPVALVDNLEFPFVEFLTRSGGSVTKRGETLGTVSWSPDGTLIALKTYWNNNQNSIYLLRSDGTDLQEVVTQKCCYGAVRAGHDSVVDWGDCCDPEPGFFRSEVTWSPDGSRLAYVHLVGTIDFYFPYAYPYGELDRSLPPPLEESVGEPSIDWSPNGLIYYSNWEQGQIYTVYPDGSGLDSLGVRGHSFEVSPDGTTLAYTTGFPETQEIFLMDLNSRSSTYLTNGNGPEWSPDSQQIAFLEQEKEGWFWINRAIKIIHRDGSGEQTIYEYETVPLNSFGHPAEQDIDWSPWLPESTSIESISWGEVKSK